MHASQAFWEPTRAGVAAPPLAGSWTRAGTLAEEAAVAASGSEAQATGDPARLRAGGPQAV